MFLDLYLSLFRKKPKEEPRRPCNHCEVDHTVTAVQVGRTAAEGAPYPQKATPMVRWGCASLSAGNWWASSSSPLVRTRFLLHSRSLPRSRHIATPPDHPLPILCSSQKARTERAASSQPRYGRPNSSIPTSPLQVQPMSPRFSARRIGAIGSADAIPVGIGPMGRERRSARADGVSLGF
jgi:hypothetical protein